jgi:ATP-dependent DNA helicase RecQ
LLLYSGADAAKWRMIVQRGGEEYGDDETVRAQLALLNHMQRFAGRARCRHRSLSEYFGQDYNEPSCGACDVCLNELDLVPDSHVTAQKILSAVARTGQRYGASYVIDVLRGSKNEKVMQRGHNEIPTFGLLKDLPAMRLGNFIDQLIDESVLVRTDGEYPVLVLNEASAEVLRSTRQIELRSPKGGLDQKPRRRRSAAGTSVARELNGSEHEVFDRLRAVRRKLASDLGVPPYVVFSDATLEELARERPTTRSQMLDIKGVGPKKLDSFGPQFLEALAE